VNRTIWQPRQITRITQMDSVAGSIVRLRPYYSAVIAVGFEKSLQPFRRIVFHQKRRLSNLHPLRRAVRKEHRLERMIVPLAFGWSAVHWCLTEFQLGAYEDCIVVSCGFAHLGELIGKEV
jgi:hypothetical protein